MSLIQDGEYEILEDLERKSIQAYHLLRLLIQYHDPELCSILDSKKIVPNLYAKDWFCSLFVKKCSPKLAPVQIWDTHFNKDDPFLVFFAALVMVLNASDELKKSNLSQSDMLNILKGMPSKLQEDDIEDLYYLVSNYYANSTPRSIRTYNHFFFVDALSCNEGHLGNENPNEGQPESDLKTTHLTTQPLDLSHYLCLPIFPAEIFALDTAQLISSPTPQTSSSLRYFLVDCRPAEQYNAGHLTKAFHLDCSLMLREPSSFTTAVQALLVIQKQVVASKSNAGGQHLCFIGSDGSNEGEDQYVNMVVASFLQKYQKYVSLVVGGFDAIHNYVSSNSELKHSFNKYIVDHNPELCKICNLNLSGSTDKLKSKKADQSLSGIGSAQSLLASTTSFLRGDKNSLSTSAIGKLTANPQASATAYLIAQSGASMFDKFASKSGVIKNFLIEKLNTTSIPSPALSSSGPSGARGHVSSQDKLGRRYTGTNLKYAIDDNDDLNNRNEQDRIVEPIQEIQVDVWQRQTKLLASYKCAQIKGNTKYPGYVALSNTHLWILREIPHNKGFASIAAKRPLDTIIQITSKRRQPDLIIFRYGYPNQINANNGTIQQQQQSTSEDNSSLDSHKIDSTPKTTTTATTTKGQKVKSLPSTIASDHLHIPQAFELIRLIKREIVRIMDESTRDSEPSSVQDCSSSSEQTTKNSSDKEQKREAEVETSVDEDEDEDEDKDKDKGEEIDKGKEIEKEEK